MADEWVTLFTTLFPGCLKMIYLASQSPRRAELLKQIGVPFRKLQCEIDETPNTGESPPEYVLRMAREKARAGRQQLSMQQKTPGPLLAADTSVVCDQRILGKPENRQEAFDTLTLLSGRSHQVMTAVAVTDSRKEESCLVVTDVVFNPLSPELINRYIDSGEPADKAGSYGIQGFGAVLVASITGSYSGVVGLPLTETAGLLGRFGVSVWNTPEAI